MACLRCLQQPCLAAQQGGATSITTSAFGLEEHLYGATGSNQGNTYDYTLAGRLVGLASGTSTLSTQDFLADALGSVLASFSATPGSTAMLGNQVYGPYGNALYAQGVMGTAKGYTGQYGDSIGLDYYNARYYDPVVGLFISADTMQGNVQGVDPYAYVVGNPETNNDPTGHCDSACNAMQIGMTVAEALDPLIALGGTIGEANVTINAWLDGRTPTADELLTARMEGDMYGVIGTFAVPAIVCGFAGVCGATVGAVAAYFGLASTIEFAFATNTVTKIATAWDAAHPVNDLKAAVNNQLQQSIAPRLPTKPKPSIFIPQQSTRPSPQPNLKPVFPLPGQHFSSPFPPSPPQSNGLAGSSTVVAGDTLWGIATRFYGSGGQWGRIYSANTGVIGGNPNVIYAGERLVIPR